MSDYYNSAIDIHINESRVIAELKKHNIIEADIQQFFKEVKPTTHNGLYLATDVLEWLGY